MFRTWNRFWRLFILRPPLQLLLLVMRILRGGWPVKLVMSPVSTLHHGAILVLWSAYGPQEGNGHLTAMFMYLTAKFLYLAAKYILCSMFRVAYGVTVCKPVLNSKCAATHVQAKMCLMMCDYDLLHFHPLLFIKRKKKTDLKGLGVTPLVPVYVYYYSWFCIKFCLL